MLRYLLDTDHLTLYEYGHPSVSRRVKLHTGTIGISVVTIYEILRGRLAQIGGARDGPTRISSYRSLAQSLLDFTEFPNVPYDQPAEDEFQRLRSIRVGTRDLKIASIALANGLIVATRNRSDFSRVPGLTIEDSSV
jgi:tRNA(fMet)-specific endonuclease VapC